MLVSVSYISLLQLVYIIDKFIPYESNTEAKIHINTKISNNTHQSIGTSISDFFHYYNKEFKFGFFS